MNYTEVLYLNLTIVVTIFKSLNQCNSTLYTEMRSLFLHEEILRNPFAWPQPSNRKIAHASSDSPSFSPSSSSSFRHFAAGAPGGLGHGRPAVGIIQPKKR